MTDRLSSYHRRIEKSPEDGRFKRRAATGLGITAVAAAVLGAGYYEARGPEVQAPHELHVAGVINMAELRAQIPAPANPNSTIMDAAGVEVVKIGEYTPIAGQKVINGEAEFVRVSPLAPAELEDKLDQVVAADAEVLNSMAEQGKLGAIRFNIAVDNKDDHFDTRPEGDARFIPAGRQGGLQDSAVIEYTLPPTGVVSLNTMAGLVAHEARHIGQRTINAIDKQNETTDGAEVFVDTEAYRADIAAIREEAIAVAERDPVVIAAAEHVLEVTAGNQTAAAQTERKIATAVLDGAYNGLQPTHENPNDRKDFIVDEGRLDLPQHTELFNSGLSKQEINETTPAQQEAMRNLDLAFDEALESPESPLSLFDESSYMESSPGYGHPTANIGELMGSAENVAHSYTKRLVDRLKRFPDRVRKIVVRFLKRVDIDSQRANGTVAPETGDHIKWIERQLD